MQKNDYMVHFACLLKFPAGYGFLKDQFRRSSLSIVLNIAEGNGKYSKTEKARFYKIARGSSSESSAILDAALIFHLINEEEREKGRVLLYRLVCMLSKTQVIVFSFRSRYTVHGHQYRVRISTIILNFSNFIISLIYET